MEDSIFTKIIKGEIPAHKIYEDENVIAFLDIFPKHEGHTLVVPKVQVEQIWDLDDEQYSTLLGTTKKIAKHLRNTMQTKRVGVIVEGVDVPHVHIHLLPFDDQMNTQPNNSEPDHEKLALLAEKIRRTM